MATIRAAGDEDAIFRLRFGVSAAQHQQHPGVVGQLAQGGITYELVRALAVKDDALLVLRGILGSLLCPVSRRDADTGEDAGKEKSVFHGWIG